MVACTFAEFTAGVVTTVGSVAAAAVLVVRELRRQPAGPATEADRG